MVCFNKSDLWHLVCISYFLNVLSALTVLNTVSLDGNMHVNDMQMRLCSSIYGDFWEESGGDARMHNPPLTGV